MERDKLQLMTQQVFDAILSSLIKTDCEQQFRVTPKFRMSRVRQMKVYGAFLYGFNYCRKAGCNPASVMVY
ncbi:hypothetical protein A9P44_07710 [Paenibacillus polymyxa]|nr:hypothetical protein A9P44_07710 [Paenibacillus polymyxa]